MATDRLLATEFELYLQFEKDSQDPQRVFRTLTRVIDVLGELDSTLVRLLQAEWKAELVLLDLEAGSLRTRLSVWLVPALKEMTEGEPGKAIKDGSLAKIIGWFINKALVFLLRYLENKQGLANPEELRYLKDNIDKLAEQAAIQMRQLPTDVGTLPTGKLADEISDLTKALAALRPGDSLAYRSAEGIAQFNPRFQTENLSQLAGAGQESSTQYRIRLRIKRPDFLGEARWEFRLNEQQTIAAKITDERWLHRFHAGEVLIKSGDLLEVDLVTDYLHTPNYTTSQVHYTITRVWRVISPKPPAAGLPLTLFD